MSLNQHVPWSLTPPGAPRNLHDKLRHTLGSPKIRAKKTTIGVEHADKSNIRKVMTFGQHLGADQNVGVLGSNPGKNFFQCTFAPRTVTVQTIYACLRKSRRQCLRNSLRAHAAWKHIGFALRARGGGWAISAHSGDI